MLGLGTTCIVDSSEKRLPDGLDNTPVGFDTERFARKVITEPDDIRKPTTVREIHDSLGARANERDAGDPDSSKPGRRRGIKFPRGLERRRITDRDRCSLRNHPDYFCVYRKKETISGSVFGYRATEIGRCAFPGDEKGHRGWFSHVERTGESSRGHDSAIEARFYAELLCFCYFWYRDHRHNFRL